MKRLLTIFSFVFAVCTMSWAQEVATDEDVETSAQDAVFKRPKDDADLQVGKPVDNENTPIKQEENKKKIVAVTGVAAQGAAVPETEAEEGEDSLYVALLTCEPGWDAYKMFGHTAIRVRNLHVEDADWAFNYGIFDFNSKNFIWRFVVGETDYILSAEPTHNFFDRYSKEGLGVTEQELALSPAEKTELVRLLVINAQPENRTYRYNFLYDNCTTRARDKICEVAGKRLKTNSQPLDCTYRDILHQFTEGSPWTEFGIDFVLGCEVDRKVDAQTQQFIPSIYMADADSTTLFGDSIGVHPLVADTRFYAPQGQPDKGFTFPVTPLTLFWVLLGVAILLSLLDWQRRRPTLWFDILLIFAQGVTGIVVFILFFFSEHPAVGTNWLVVTFNPLIFVMIWDIVRLHKHHKLLLGIHKRDGKVIDWREIANLAGLGFALLLYWLPLQVLNPAMLPLVLTLLIRSIVRMNMRVSKNYY